MSIDPDRISRDIETIAGLSHSTPDIGYSRPTFTRAWRAARDYVIEQAKAAGCKVRIDAAGNVHARHHSIDWSQKVWLSGSHIDSVPTGGKYDGVIGVVCPLEVLRSAAEAGRSLPLELIIFAEEEGTTFGLGMIGSRLWVNPAEATHIDEFKNCEGQTYFQAGQECGVSRELLSGDRFDSSHYFSFIEIHIEQGPAMWAHSQPLAVVTAISGRKQYKGELTGSPNHAGSTPMSFRADSLVAVARIICGVDKMARACRAPTVATVGRIECEPNAINVIPGTVRFTIDLRSPDPAVLAGCHDKLEKLVMSESVHEPKFFMTEDQQPVVMDSALCAQLTATATIAQTVSGALHDAAILAPHIPTAMLFVASKDGLSHNPGEFSRIEDIAAAAVLLEKVVSRG